MFVISTDFLEITQCSPTDFPMGRSLDNSSCQIVGEQEKYSINLHILNLRFFLLQNFICTNFPLFSTLFEIQNKQRAVPKTKLVGTLSLVKPTELCSLPVK